MGVRGRIGPLTPAQGTRDGTRFRRGLPGVLRRWLPSLVLVVAAVAVIGSTQSDSADTNVDVQNRWASVAFFLFVAGATAWVWRKARGEGFEALRWRLLHRRVFWRAATVCLLASMVSLWFVAFWQGRSDNAVDVSDLPTWMADDAHAHFFQRLAGWLAFAAAPLVVIEPYVWRLWPRELRVAARRAWVAKALSERGRMTRLDLNPGLGAVGRPEAMDAVKPGKPRSEAHRVTPHGRRPDGWTPAALDRWWRSAAIAWDGSGLVLTDGTGRSFVFPVATQSASADQGTDSASSSTTVAEIVWYCEKRYYRTSGSRLRDRIKAQILLLDADGRRLAETPAAGFTAGDAADLARASGLAFNGYDLGTVWENERVANRLLFPRTRRMVRIAAPRSG